MWYRLDCIFVFFFFLSSAISHKTGYFWREYSGKIPEDAIAAGEDSSGQTVYIGQAYVRDLGLFPAQITPGMKTVHAAIYGTRRADDYTKILCGEQDQFSWIPSTSERLERDLLNKTPVIGGHSDGQKKLYVGRISYEGGVQIGKVDRFWGSKFWWVDNKIAEQGFTSFEVLIFENDEQYQMSVL